MARRLTPATSAGRLFTLDGVGRGLMSLIGTAPAIVAFGIGYGAAAIAKGLSAWTILAMSAFVFSGAVQFAALDMLKPAPMLLALCLVTLAINARHVFLGATLHSYLRPASRPARLAALGLLSDANWATTTKAMAAGERDVGFLFGGGILLWIAWLLGTALGLAFGSAIGDPRALWPRRRDACLFRIEHHRSDLEGTGLAALGARCRGRYRSLLLLDFFSIFFFNAFLIGAACGAACGAWRDRAS